MKSYVQEIVDISNYLYEKKLVSGLAGNVSCRFENENTELIAISPTSKSLENLNPEDVVLIDMEGNIISDGKPSSEVKMHLKIYQARNDVNAIVHTHSPFATGFAFSTKRIKRLEGFGKVVTPFLEDIEYETPGSIELAIKAAEGIGNEDVLILKNHGVLTVGKNLKEASSLAGFVEDIAKTQFISHMLNLSENIK